MKILFRQSGGDGPPRGCELNTGNLHPDEATELMTLLNEAGLHDSFAAHSHQGSGVTRYDLTVETPDGIRTASVDDLTAPDNLRPLLEFLIPRTRPLPSAHASPSWRETLP